MNQYEFRIQKGTYVNSVFCTSQNSAKAYMAVVAKYAPEFTIGELPISIRPAHNIYSEIDATA